MTATRTLLVLLCFAFLQICASPVSEAQNGALLRRTDPVFPEEPESCQICAKDYASIQNCAEAAPVFENFTMVMFNPGAFVDAIECACTETFKAVFPQCVDCFIRTGQEAVIMGHDLPAMVEGVREICAVASTLLGNVTDANNAPDPTPTPSSTAPPHSAQRLALLLAGLSALIAFVGCL